MAHTSTHHDAPFSPVAAIQSLFAAIGNGLVAMGSMDSRLRQAEALHALSDAELAERGLRRQDIARYVYNDAFWG